MTKLLRRTSDGVAQALRTLARVDEWPARLGPLLEQARDVLEFAAQRAREMRLPQVAGSLTFTTVLALVPLLAVALSIFTTFPMFGEFRAALEKDLLRELLPEQYAAQLLRYLNNFAAKATQLTAYGLVFLAATAMLMIHTVERALNELWLVQQRRPWAQRVVIYWTLITLGPVLVGASLAATSYLLSTSAGLVQQLPGLLRAAVDYLPLLVSGLAYAALYVLVPNRKVRWRDALIGGFAAALVGELIREGFAAYIRTGTVATIYGAFAAVPLFLLWVYLAWFVVLFGAAIAATLPMLRSTRFADERRAGNRFVTAVALLRALYDGHRRGGEAARIDTGTLARAVRLFPEEAERLLGELERLNYVARLEGVNAGCWLLVCDPERTDLVEVFKRFAVDPANTLVARDEATLGAWMKRALEADWLRAPLARTFAGTA
ncbi:MAG: YihY family inner membrane protein [Burkholderiaceae bacterium]|nr:YihY family inner membrane protein [Burkholderiaceae bacterium]